MDEKIYSKEVKKILNDYFGGLKLKIRILPKAERQEILDEIQSDILAELQQEGKEDSSKQTELLLSILENLGKPDEVANEILSRRLISLRGNFLRRFFVFTSWSMLRAIVSFVVSFVSLILYFIGLLNIAMAGLKVFMPEKIGLFVSENKLVGYGFKMGSWDIALGSITRVKGEEILGYWIVPIGIIIGFVFVIFTNFTHFKLKKLFS